MSAFYRLLIAATLTGVLIPATGVMSTTGQLVTAGAIIHRRRTCSGVSAHDLGAR